MNLRCTHKHLSKSPGIKWVLTLQGSFYTLVSPSHYISIVPHIVKYRGNKRPSLCKNVLQTTYIACTAGLKSALLVKQTAVSEIQPVRPICHGILSCFVLRKNTFPAGYCPTVHLTVNIPAQWLWLISQVGSVSHRRECFSLFSALLFCF